MSLQPKPSEIPEFRDVEQLLDGSWRAVHRPSGEVIAAVTFYQLEQIEAPAVRIAYTLRAGVMRRVSAPWSDPTPDLRTGDLP